jgi:hypothetical protein
LEDTREGNGMHEIRPTGVLGLTEVESPTPKDDDVQKTDRHDLGCDVVVVGGGFAGSSASLALGNSRRPTPVLNAGEPRNAPSSGVHRFFS